MSKNEKLCNWESESPQKSIKTCNKSVGINFTKSVVYASGADGTRFDFRAITNEIQNKARHRQSRNKQFWFRSNKKFPFDILIFGHGIVGSDLNNFSAVILIQQLALLNPGRIQPEE